MQSILYSRSCLLSLYDKVNNFFFSGLRGICLVIMLMAIGALGCKGLDDSGSTQSFSNTAVMIDSLVAVDITYLSVPDISVDKADLVFEGQSSLWLSNGEEFSGYCLDYYESGASKSRVGVVNGKKENKATHWYPNGGVKRIAHYHEGKLHGQKKVWSADTSHTLLSHLHYRNGQPHGEQKTWYPTGELHKQLNLNMGREKGRQQAFRQNGALYANYEAKNGRIFGLKKASLCYGLEDQNIQYEE